MRASDRSGAPVITFDHTAIRNSGAVLQLPVALEFIASDRLIAALAADVDLDAFFQSYQETTTRTNSRSNFWTQNGTQLAQTDATELSTGKNYAGSRYGTAARRRFAWIS